jgi:hypothetical protein
MLAGWDKFFPLTAYEGCIARHTKIIAGKSFIAEVLPMDRVEGYFYHFPVLEIDFIFANDTLENNVRRRLSF